MHPKLHTDLFAILLMYKVKNKDEPDPLEFQEFLRFHTTNDLKPDNIFQLSITRKWPLLSVLSAVVKTYPMEYCWTNFLMITSRYKCAGDYQNLYDLVKDVCLYCISEDCIEELYESLVFFYPNFSLIYLVKFFMASKQKDFELATDNLKQFVVLMEDYNDIWIVDYEEKYLSFTTELSMRHFISNFHNASDIYKLLVTLCDSDAYFLKTNFDYLKKIFEILKTTTIIVDFNWIEFSQYNKEMCEKLIDDGSFEEAMRLVNCLKLDRCPFVYRIWTSLYAKHQDNFNYKRLAKDLEKYQVNATYLIDFYLYVYHEIDSSDHKQKYLVLKKALDAMKDYSLQDDPKYNRDSLEYELLMHYVKIDDSNLQAIPIYHSEYYEKMVEKNQNLIFHSFQQLKEFAQLDTITITGKILSETIEVERLHGLLRQLLDLSDFVQALRIQAMFDQRPIELNFLVFIFGLVEGIASLTDLPREERYLFNRTKGSMPRKRSQFNLRCKLNLLFFILL